MWPATGRSGTLNPMVDIPPVTIAATDLRPNTRVCGTFLVRQKRRGVGRTGKPWLQLVLGDRTGTIDARIWENADSYDASIPERVLVDVEGQGVEFNGRTQLRITRITLHPAEVDTTEWLPRSNLDPVDVETALRDHQQRLTSAMLQRLVGLYLDDREWLHAFCRAPAARTVHHAEIGGLAAHTLSMMQLAYLVCDHYRQQGVVVDRDLVVVGALLHDSGKVEELSVEQSFEYTDVGRLLGHIQLGIDRLDRAVAAIDDFPEPLHLHLRHLILSHHGEYEYGSPRRPKTLEAMLLHQIDMLDSRVGIVTQAMQSAGDETWTGVVPALNRHLMTRSPSHADDTDTA